LESAEARVSKMGAVNRLHPGILQVVTTLRTVFLLYTAAAVSGLVVEIGSNKTMLFAAMVALSVFLATHLYRSFP